MSIEDAVTTIKKKYGSEAIFTVTDEIAPIDVIKTGSLFLDEAIGVGGYPKGRIIELYGPESAGKTTLLLHAMAETQKAGGRVAFIDAEHSLDLEYAQGIGVDLSKLFISQPSCGEEALDIAEILMESEDVELIAIDSVAALTPKAEIEGDMGQSHMGLQARLMSQAMRKLVGLASKTNTCVAFTNQIRMKIGVVWGNPETTTGGNALKFYSSVRLEIRIIEKLTKSGSVYGNRVKIKVVKNKVAMPFKEVETTIIFGKGIYRPGELLSYHIDKGFIDKAGAWYKYKDQKIQGEEKMWAFIEEHIDEFEIGDKK